MAKPKVGLPMERPRESARLVRLRRKQRKEAIRELARLARTARENRWDFDLMVSVAKGERSYMMLR